jgi:3-hydroxymyristoyl/3-hydroxydecanoyl-(acyl carrier protein) dehydratase
MTDGRSQIDALRRSDGSLDRTAVQEVLPYGEDFLFVDRVARLTSKEVEASFVIPEQSAYLRSHFVDLPMMPGVLIGEGLAQAGSLIVRYNLPTPEEHHVLGLKIERARFQSPALPAETLTYRVRLVASNSRAARLEGNVLVGERRVCEAKLVVAIVDRTAFRDRLSSQGRTDRS